MSPTARSKQVHRLRWSTYLRTERRKATRWDAFARECTAFLHTWAVSQDGRVQELPLVQQALYHQYREHSP